MPDNDSSTEEHLTPQAEAEEVAYLQPVAELLVPGCYVLFSENEYTVVGLKSTNEEKTTFKLIATDVSTVPSSDICALLPIPVVDAGDENTVRFGRKVDVKEFSKQV
ncbi:hypothetical protein FQR65_LT07738 [Abscondita terminalis]|nr:hypothetical protein FQR65_LT07738 [Abscondita terminalis]